MSSFLMFVIYNNSLFFRFSMIYAYGFNLPPLSYVLLKTVKTYQMRNPWYILRKEVIRGFNLAWNQRQGIYHSSYLLLILPHWKQNPKLTLELTERRTHPKINIWKIIIMHSRKVSLCIVLFLFLKLMEVWVFLIWVFYNRFFIITG